MQFDRDVLVCGIYFCVFSKHLLLGDLLLLLFWRGVMLSFSLFFYAL
jgi:hypothetical protein